MKARVGRSRHPASRDTSASLRVGLWLLALVLIAGFVSLGRWQLHRASEKQQMLDAVASALSRKQAQPQALAESTDVSGYTWASGRGHFLAAPALLLDNQRRGDSVGVHVFGVFQPEQGGALLVDLGWLPLPGDRHLPELDLPEGEQTVAGLLTPPPSSGLALGPAYIVPDAAQGRASVAGGTMPGATAAQGRASVAGGTMPGATARRWLLTRIDIAALAEGLHIQLAPRVLRLDPALPLGYTRDLDVLPNTLPPERHRGYALQWFGLALATLILALFLGFRRRPA